MRAPLVVLPPPGLAAWAFPRLAEADAALSRQGLVDPGSAVLDLARDPLPAIGGGAILADRRVRVPSGARGDAVAGWLRARFGTTSERIPETSGLERLQGGRAEPAFAVALPLEDAGPRRLPLADVPAAAEGWVLVLRGEPGLAAAEAHADRLAGRGHALLWEDASPDEIEREVERTTRLSAFALGLLPGECYPEPQRERVRRLVARLNPEALPRFLHLENAALAGVDLVEHALLGRGGRMDGPRAEPRAGRPWVFAISGLDGAGKSTHVAALVEHLRARGLRAEAFKMYRHGVFHETVTELTRGCAGERDLHLWRAQRVLKGFDSLAYLEGVVRPALETCDALVFDRWLDTHHCAGPTRYGHDPFTRELLRGFPPLDRLFLLDAAPATAIARLETRDERTVDENPRMLSAFARGLRDLGRRSGALVLDASAPFERNGARIRSEVDALLDASADRPGGAA